MRANTRALPVENWDVEPELEIVKENGAKSESNGSKRTPVVVRRIRPEMEVLGWEARIGRLISLARSR